MFRYRSFKKAGKFSIGSSDVTVDYIHAGVFVPVFNSVGGMDDHSFTFGSSNNPAQRIRYWEEHVYGSEHEVSPGSGTGSPPAGKYEKLPRPVSKLTRPSTAPRTSEPPTPSGTLEPLKTSATPEPRVQPLDTEPKAKKRKGEHKGTKQQKKVSRVSSHQPNFNSCFQVLPPHLQLWTDRRAELHGEKPSSGAKKTESSVVETAEHTEILGK